jgi:hypothetical protein
MHEFRQEPAAEEGAATATVARMAPVTIFYSGPGVGLG